MAACTHETSFLVSTRGKSIEGKEIDLRWCPRCGSARIEGGAWRSPLVDPPDAPEIVEYPWFLGYERLGELVSYAAQEHYRRHKVTEERISANVSRRELDMVVREIDRLRGNAELAGHGYDPDEVKDVIERLRAEGKRTP